MILPRTDTEITEKIIKSGIRPSIQRIQVYGFLCRNPIHPTVDTVYTALAPSIPTLSKTTVYNTLKLLAEHNLVQTITIENEELRYDADTSNHLHFKCKKCNEVFDVHYSDTNHLYSLFEQQLPQGFKADKIQTCIWGTCSSCNNTIE